MPEYARVCQSIPEYARVLPSFAFTYHYSLYIPVVAQKVKVQCSGPVCSEKVGGAAAAVSLIGRDGNKSS